MTEYIKREDVRDILAEVYAKATTEDAERACIEINARVIRLPKATGMDLKRGQK